ncbi:MAG: FAD-dependent oxidoreductase [Thermodesulfobacteria bacterium]|nr:FAD-dependent oxidoreductase [Thermodesulfobacteriota bacterium]
MTKGPSAIIDTHNRPSVLVVGAGISGIQAALDLSQMGFYVFLLERGDVVGGLLLRLGRTFPSGDCPT